MSYFVFVNFSDFVLCNVLPGRSDGVFAVAKLVKLICLTKFYGFFLIEEAFFVFKAAAHGDNDAYGAIF